MEVDKYADFDVALKHWYDHCGDCVVCRVTIIACAHSNDRDAYCEEGIELAQVTHQAFIDAQTGKN
jgi:hypothetical protein